MFRFLLKLFVDTLCTAVTSAESRSVIWKVPAQTVKERIVPPWCKSMRDTEGWL